VSKRQDSKRVPKELPWSWHNSRGWPGQLDRTRRWRGRIGRATDPDDVTDFLFAFFQSCYALRDWLELSFEKKAINYLFDETPALQLCRDIANMTKHHRLTRPPSTGTEPSIAREYVDEGEGWFAGNSHLLVLSQGRQFDALELADECLMVVEDFVRRSTAVPQV
jgi:hypothetical protein